MKPHHFFKQRDCRDAPANTWIDLQPAPQRGRRCRTMLSLIVSLASIVLLLATSSCKQGQSGGQDSSVAYYTCTMHPSVKAQDPKAKCPICGMALVPVKKKTSQPSDPASGQSSAQAGHEGHSGHEAHAGPKSQPPSDEAPSEFTVPVNRQQQIGVTYATVKKGPLRLALRTVGVVAYDKQRHWNFVSRVDGYIQKLYVSSRGELVEKDQPLLTIYSPDLLTTQRELLDLLRLRDQSKQTASQAAVESSEGLIESAKRRLARWNITEKQIAELEQSRTATETLTLYSPFKGAVQNLPVDQGRRVAMGEQLVEMADLSVVWVWAQFYQNELPLLKKGLPVIVTTPSYPGEPFAGQIGLVDPFIDEATRTGRVRLELQNADFRLRPDMYVDVELGLDLGEGLVIPVNAVMPTGQRNIAFVDKGEGKLEPRFVELGQKFGTNYLVNAGLKEGERVVDSANFLIDAEAKVQGALRSW
jgi:membrane fusion protein, copper/silver efflux system